jgi:hypothetical protein
MGIVVMTGIVVGARWYMDVSSKTSNVSTTVPAANIQQSPSQTSHDGASAADSQAVTPTGGTVPTSTSAVIATSNVLPTSSVQVSVVLDNLYPVDTPARQWTLIARKDVGLSNPAIQMKIQNETIKPGEYIDWYTNGPNQRSKPVGSRNGEKYHVCVSKTMKWI